MNHCDVSGDSLMIYRPFSSFYLVILTNSHDFPGSNYD